METWTADFLKQELAQRQRKNPHYSLRAFARDMQLHPGSLSAAMNGRRSLPEREIQRIARVLGLSPRQTQTLFKRRDSDANPRRRLISSRQLVDDELNFRILAEWEYFAVLSLMETKDFVPSYDHVSQRLGISTLRASIVVHGLVEAKLIRMDEDRWIKLDQNLHTSEDIESAALQRAHIEELEVARRKLESVAVELRDFSSLSFATSESKIPKIKEMIREFRRSLLEFAEDERVANDQVYQLCVQLFPLSKSIEESAYVEGH